MRHVILEQFSELITDTITITVSAICADNVSSKKALACPLMCEIRLG